MKPPAARRSISAATVVVALAALFATDASGAPVGLIHEIPIHGNVGGIAAGPEGNLWFTQNAADPGKHEVAIGRITPGGRITEFSDCLRAMPQFAGPNFLTLGPDGNVWLTTWPSGDDAHPVRASTPSIGRITPSGRITEFRLGLRQRSAPESLVATGGRLWFIDRETESIGMIAPSRAPTNTFLVLSPHTPRGTNATRIPVVVPGPGKPRLRELTLHLGRGRHLRLPGLKTTTVRAPGCGPTKISLVPEGTTRARLRNRAVLRMDVRITFIPRGGSAFSRDTTVVLRARAGERASLTTTPSLATFPGL